MKQQISLSMTGYFDKGKQTKREQFLAEMERVVPWARLMDLIEPYYPKGGQGAGGRPPLPLATALECTFCSSGTTCPIRPRKKRCMTRWRCAALPGW